MNFNEKPFDKRIEEIDYKDLTLEDAYLSCMFEKIIKDVLKILAELKAEEDGEINNLEQRVNSIVFESDASGRNIMKVKIEAKKESRAKLGD